MSPNCHLIVSSASGSSEMSQKEETIITRNPKTFLSRFRDRTGGQTMGTILVIEDNERILKALQPLFSSEGYETRRARTPRHAPPLFPPPRPQSLAPVPTLPQHSRPRP